MPVGCHCRAFVFIHTDKVSLKCDRVVVFVYQTGESGGEAEGMGAQESVGGGGAARLLPGAFSWP